MALADARGNSNKRWVGGGGVGKSVRRSWRWKTCIYETLKKRNGCSIGLRFRWSWRLLRGTWPRPDEHHVRLSEKAFFLQKIHLIQFYLSVNGAT
ncbi:unnamed protein product, partial [Nesidiocoris tenuis]